MVQAPPEQQVGGVDQHGEDRPSIQLDSGVTWERLTAEHDPAIMLLAKIVNGADTDNTLWNQPESAGLNAIAEGFRHLSLTDDHAILTAEAVVYDALYAYCQEMVRRGKPDGAFK